MKHFRELVDCTELQKIDKLVDASTKCTSKMIAIGPDLNFTDAKGNYEDYDAIT